MCCCLSLERSVCLPTRSLLVYAFVCRLGSFRWVYMQINVQQYLEHSCSLQSGSILFIVIWIISKLDALHQTSINNFSETFIMLEVTSLFKHHACLLVLDIPQDNTLVGFRWSNVALSCTHRKAMHVSVWASAGSTFHSYFHLCHISSQFHSTLWFRTQFGLHA